MRHFTSILLLTLLAVSAAPGQSTNVVADAPPDYSTFSQFIATRNIFNPDRVPIHESTGRRRRRSTPAGTPFIALVGTMNYQKGMFAFFNGNPADNQKVLQNDGKIAGYTVKEITPAGVVLTSAGTNVVRLSIGAQLRQDGTNWELVAAGDTQTSATETTTSSAGNAASSTDDAGSTPPAAIGSSSEPNDVLKRLMEKRAQEMK
jgi:hypothetical protein